MKCRPAVQIEQRWLLWHMGGWQIVDALCSPEGVKALMGSRWGSTGKSRELPNGAPSWLKGCGWETEASTITPRWLGGRPTNAPTFTIKPAHINSYAAVLPEPIKEQLLECRAESQANAVLQYRFCRCGSKPCGYRYLKDRICPPTPEQENQAHADYWRIRALEHVVLSKALALKDEPAQLELFGAAS
jgi:hypothetical protein